MKTINSTDEDELAEASLSRMTNQSGASRSRISKGRERRSVASDFEGSGSARERFHDVAWTETSRTTSARTSDGDDRPTGESEVESFEPAEVRARFERVPWHPSEVGGRGESGTNEWAEQMKVKNFFDGLE